MMKWNGLWSLRISLHEKKNCRQSGRHDTDHERYVRETEYIECHTQDKG